jgi:hypothetical protein
VTSYNAPGGVTYNYAQLEYIWMQANGNAQVAPIAAAIAMAESGGVTTATDLDSNGSVDRGLWQINSVHGSQSTYDVMGNARAAVAISSNGTNWQPWTTYTNGAYRNYLQVNTPPAPAPINGTNAAATLTSDIPGTPIPNPFSWIPDPIQWFAGQANQQIKDLVTGSLDAILNPLIQIVAGIMGITAGGALVAVGIFVIVRQTDTGRAATNLAGQAAVGAVAPEAEGAAATRRPPPRTSYRYHQRPNPAGEQTRTKTFTFYDPSGARHTSSTQEVLRNEAWEYYEPQGSRR